MEVKDYNLLFRLRIKSTNTQRCRYTKLQELYFIPNIDALRHGSCCDVNSSVNLSHFLYNLSKLAYNKRKKHWSATSWPRILQHLWKGVLREDKAKSIQYSLPKMEYSKSFIVKRCLDLSENQLLYLQNDFLTGHFCLKKKIC